MDFYFITLEDTNTCWDSEEILIRLHTIPLLIYNLKNRLKITKLNSLQSPG